MGKIKEIRALPSKVKLIKEVGKEESDLERETEDEEVQKFSNFLSTGEFTAPIISAESGRQETFEEAATKEEKPKPVQALERPYDYPERTLMGAQPTDAMNAPIPLLKPVHHIGEHRIAGFGADELERIHRTGEETPYQERVGVEVKKIERKKMPWE